VIEGIEPTAIARHVSPEEDMRSSREIREGVGGEGKLITEIFLPCVGPMYVILISYSLKQRNTLPLHRSPSYRGPIEFEVPHHMPTEFSIFTLERALCFDDCLICCSTGVENDILNRP
jgi:hypothetical protein